jgi:hypothetical protein
MVAKMPPKINDKPCSMAGNLSEYGRGGLYYF